MAFDNVTSLNDIAIRNNLNKNNMEFVRYMSLPVVIECVLRDSRLKDADNKGQSNYLIIAPRCLHIVYLGSLLIFKSSIIEVLIGHL